jgi:very-short-patch-repair endonuclease
MRRKLVEPDIAVARIAARQHGVVTTTQLLAAGLSEAGIRRRVSAGRLHPVHRGVYAAGHPGLTDRGRWKAATLACGSGCALSHRSAGELWGIVTPAGGLTHVTAPVAGGRAMRKGIRIHRSPSLTARFVTHRDNVPVTRPRRTIEDMRRELSPEALRRAVRRAEVLDLPLQGLTLAGDRTESELEWLFLALCRRFKIRRPETQVRVGRYRVDFLWRQERLIAETDGYRYHRGSIAFEDDRARDNRLVELGYEVLRFTYTNVTTEADAVAALLRSRLDRRIDDLPSVCDGNSSS